MRKLKKYKPTKFKAKDSHYDVEAADYAVNFIECLCHTKGTWAGKPFELIDWQEQIIRDIFGTLKPNGYRQFNTAYVEIPKKMGKSELAAAVALLLTCGDGEERAEVYGCAADRQQATIVFDVAADMVRMCPALNKRVKILASQKRIVYQPTNSFYQVLSAEAYSKHGFNIHGVVFDELHTQPNRKLFDVMTKGSGDARMQPLYFLITTAGTDTNSICYETHQKAKDILEGRKIDPTFYPVIYGADESDDWTDPKVWKKANPSLGITVGIDKVKAACESAKQNPGEENSFRQLRLNQWVKQAVRWMPMEKWDNCSFRVNEDDLEGRVCYGGLDLSSTTDITAFVLVFPPTDEDDKYAILPYFWVPEDTLDLRVRRDHVPYQYQMQDSDANTGKTGTVTLKPSDVLHIPGLGFDGLVGYSPIAMAKNAIGLSIATEEYGAKFFANGATPGGLLEYPGTVKNPDAIRESWNKGFSGSNSHKVAILEEGMHYTPISISPEQAQFLETRKFQIDEIARIFRVPPHMVGDLEKSSFSNIEQQSLEFVKYTLEPWIVRWEQSLNRALLTDSEKAAYFVKFNVDGLLRGDYQSRMNGYATARQNGWMSANDIRELENLDRIPPELGGDLYLINGNMTKLEDAGIFAATTAAGKEEDSDEEVLEVEKSDDDKSGDSGTDDGENSVSKRNNRRGKLV